MTEKTILQELSIRGITLRNRIGLSPMTLYCAQDGLINEWHFVHYGARAQGTGLLIVEATAISAEGRITPYDVGLWNDDFIEPLQRLTSFVHSQGSVCGIQLSHGGRKASRTRPWDGDKWIPPQDGGWRVVGPSPIPFAQGYPSPEELSIDEIGLIRQDFIRAAHRAYQADFKLIEIHAGHGRLLHSFYSPISNQRTDQYGSSFENRIRFLVEVVQGIRTVWPASYPLAVRLSCVDWLDDGWQLEDSIALARILHEQGVDIIDCSSGGIIRPLSKPTSSGYQVPLARAIKQDAGILTAAVGQITTPRQANTIIEQESADIILFGRKMLLNPHFPLEIVGELESKPHFFPPQYQRAFNSQFSKSAELIPEL